MIKTIRQTSRRIIKTFTLDNPQPVKSPFFLIFPVKGKLEIKNLAEKTLIKKQLTICDYNELKNHMMEQ